MEKGILLKVFTRSFLRDILLNTENVFEIVRALA